MQEARNAIAGGNGMAGPCFEEDHPNHSNSYVDFPFFPIFCDDNHGARWRWIVGNIGTAAAFPLLLLGTITLNVDVNHHGYSDWRVLGQRSTTSRVLYTSTLYI